MTFGPWSQHGIGWYGDRLTPSPSPPEMTESQSRFSRVGFLQSVVTQCRIGQDAILPNPFYNMENVSCAEIVGQEYQVHQIENKSVCYWKMKLCSAAQTLYMTNAIIVFAKYNYF